MGLLLARRSLIGRLRRGHLRLLIVRRRREALLRETLDPTFVLGNGGIEGWGCGYTRGSIGQRRCTG